MSQGVGKTKGGGRLRKVNVMKKGTKKLIIACSIVVVIVIALLIGVGVFIGGMIEFHYSSLGHNKDQLWIENEEIKVTDYVTDLAIFGDEDTMNYVGFEVYDKKTDKLLFKSDPVCRAWDYKEFYIEKNTNDIVVCSGDVGNIYYEQVSETEWRKVEQE